MHTESTKSKKTIDKRYKKLSLSLDQQINLLKERGLIINDENFAKNKLNLIGYYHLSAYFKSYQNTENNMFHKNITFEQILNLYTVDRKIKLLCFDAIERIELSVKSLLTNEMTKDFGSFWYMNRDLFHEKFDHITEMNRLQKSVNKAKNKKFGFVKHYYETYSDEQYVPSWILMEVLTFGAVLKIFRGLKRKYRKQVAKCYYFDEKIIASWFEVLLDVRNICAHHERLWNRNLKQISIPKESVGFIKNGKMWNIFLIFSYLLSVLSPKSEMIPQIISLLEKSHINLTSMGFGNNWQKILLSTFSEKRII